MQRFARRRSLAGERAPWPATPFDRHPDGFAIDATDTPALQPKLRVGAPGDRHEREADLVSDMVMRTPPQPALRGRGSETPSPSEEAPALQRLCTDCEEELQRQPLEEQEQQEQVLQRQPLEEQEQQEQQEQALQRQPLEEQEQQQTLMAKAQAPAAPRSTLSGLQPRLDAMRHAGGQSLPETSRAFFESRMGYDLSRVRVHSGAGPAEAASAINARAFAFGRDIAFGDGEFNPVSRAGKRLLAHELAHVVQQGGARSLSEGERSRAAHNDADAQPVVRRSVSVNAPNPQERVEQEDLERLRQAGVSPKLEVGAVDDPAERRADEVADAVLRMPAPAARGQAAARGEAGATVQSTSGGDSGASLRDGTRRFFEPRLGVDLSDVRVHAGARAANAAHRLNARAFAHRQHIWLGRGESEGDRRLIAHELAHVTDFMAGRPGGAALRRYTRSNTTYLWDLYVAAGRSSASISDAQLRTTIEYEDYRRGDLTWQFSDTVAIAATRRSLALFDSGVRGRRPNYIRSGREARAAAHGITNIALTELGFTGDHMITDVSTFLGATGSRIDDPDGSAPVWSSAGVSHPVAYTAGTAPTMFARFTVAPSISPDVPNVRVRAMVGTTTVGEATGLTITGTTIENSGAGTGRVNSISGGSPLPGSASLRLLPARIDFQVSTDGGTVWFNAGSAPVTFFFTLAAPTPPGALRRDALFLATTAAAGSSPPEAGLRSLVQAAVVYAPWVSMPSSFATGDAVLGAFTAPHQCDSQAYLMRYLARTIGIAADVEYFWRGAPGERWAFIYRGGAWFPWEWWWGPTFQCDRPAEDHARASPHFTFHAFTRIGGVLHDPTYDLVGLPAILESAPGSANQLGSRATFLSTTSRRQTWFCAH